MKLRIKSNSIRIRLDALEVETLATGKSAFQTTSFPGGAKLTASVEPSANVAGPWVSFHDGHLTAVLPQHQINEWASSENVSIQADLPLDEKKTLLLLIEKDFACLDRRADEPHAFPNPRATAS